MTVAELDLFVSRLRQGLPEPRYEAGQMREYRVAMRDGAELYTRVYLPEGSGPWPVVLIRNPYAGTVPMLEVTAAIWNEYGYAAVVQDCRGTGKSGGEWTPFVNERLDGLDTIDWIIRQPWMDGNIGTYGHSYLSAVQLAMADRFPQEVKAMVLSGYSTERFRSHYMNGMFRMDVYTGWALENAGTEPLDPRDLFARAVSVRPHIEMDERLFGKRLPWYRQWITSTSPLDDYWSNGFWAELREIPKYIQTPVLMAAGWFDHHLDGMLRDYRKLPQGTRAMSRLIVGPWVHTLAPSGDLEYPDGELNLMAEAIRWFDHHLRGSKEAPPAGETMTYVVREGRWRRWTDGFEANGRRVLYLAGGDKAPYRITDVPDLQEGRIGYRYDPLNPVPTRGGAGLLRYLSGAPDAPKPASLRQEPPGYRDDVISFLSDPLDEDLPIAGSVKVHLHVSSDAPDTAFTVNLMEVAPDGAAYNIRDGITSLSFRNGAQLPVEYIPGSVEEVTIELWPITWTVRRGFRLRLDVSSSNFPAYHAHSNTSGCWALQADTRVAGQGIHLGGQYPSRIEIPTADERS
ncbi:CocE/NonD family hydrolase [Thermobacillus sp.]|uniref:CocE/NonD family hydrolase n=1 Tax=Thermobacillus sp. TaxID=2108467 RepID=UPI00257DB3D7|nr:CocE/NonD family hydrolase [Thermobacillus sp.]